MFSWCDSFSFPALCTGNKRPDSPENHTQNQEFDFKPDQIDGQYLKPAQMATPKVGTATKLSLNKLTKSFDCRKF